MSALAIPADQVGFAPDSAYATWTAEQREISDRMEADYNMEASARLGLIAGDRGHPITATTDCPDGMLRRLVKQYRRNLEDVDDGSLHGGRSRARMLRAQIADIEREQERRAVLAECWQASETGTHSYSDFQGRGGLLAVVDHGARPPSYELAVLLDWEHWKLGLEHVLAWDDA